MNPQQLIAKHDQLMTKTRDRYMKAGHEAAMSVSDALYTTANAVSDANTEAAIAMVAMASQILIWINEDKAAKAGGAA